MTEQEENNAIDQVLARLLSAVSYVSLLDTFEKASIPMHFNERVFSKLKQEDLTEVIRAKSGRDAYLLKLSPRGVTVARIGYITWLQQQQERAQIEDRRAKYNTWGTVVSAIVAALALVFSAYTYFSSSASTEQLEQQLRTQNARIRVLESRQSSHAK